MQWKREIQAAMDVDTANPLGGYYNDLRSVAREYVSPEQALGWIDLYERRREHLNPVSMIQLGLGAWQLRSEDEAWLEVVDRVATWTMLDMDGFGRLAYYQPMAHTYAIGAPWFSAMAQGQAASLLVRAAFSLDRPELVEQATRALESLNEASGLVAMTDDGPVLQEYPTSPPAHVLNGWIFALFGIYDVMRANPGHEHGEPGDVAALSDLFAQSSTALAARLADYEVRGGWTRYDLYPHPLVHVASPFYHSLHIELIRAFSEIMPHEAFASAIERWTRASQQRSTRAVNIARKIGFRMARPRNREAS